MSASVRGNPDSDNALEALATNVAAFLTVDSVVALSHVNRAFRKNLWDDDTIWKTLWNEQTCRSSSQGNWKGGIPILFMALHGLVCQ